MKERPPPKESVHQPMKPVDLPSSNESRPRDPAPFVPPSAPVSVAKEVSRAQKPKDDVRIEPKGEGVPSQQRSEKAMVAVNEDKGGINLDDFVPVRLVCLNESTEHKCHLR